MVTVEGANYEGKRASMDRAWMSLAGEGGESDELGAADEYVEVAAFASSSVARMQRTVVADLQQIRLQGRL